MHALTSKQRAWLRSQANPMPSQFQVGKYAMTPALASSLDELLSTHELVKGTVLKTVDEPVAEVAGVLARVVDAQVVQVIGRKIILYRHSRKLAQQGKALILPH